MKKSASLSKNNSLKQTSPVVFAEKHIRGRASKRGKIVTKNDDSNKPKKEEHKIDIGDEHSDLLGYEIFSEKLCLDKRKYSKNADIQAPESTNLDAVDAKLTSKAIIWGSEILRLEDVVSLSYCVGLKHFTVHAYPLRKGSCNLFIKNKRIRKDYRFVASDSDYALQWVNSFADQQCFVNCLLHPVASTEQQGSDLIFNQFPPESYIRSKSPPKMLVILNPRSGRGRSSKVFHGSVEPIFKLAGFVLEVVKTTSAGHARKLAASVDFSTCPDGIICVGGDGIVNEVLNGLLSRDNQKDAISIPIGIIPAGSDNSLVWTVLGVRDPISAAIAIIKGGLAATDVFAVEWIHTGAIHFGMTVTYFGFISDVLELSEKYQKRFGPLRYFVAGFLKFLCLPKYSYEVEYLPAQKEPEKLNISSDHEIVDVTELYTDIMRRSSKEGLPRASSLSSIDSIMTPNQISDLDPSTEPSEYVRAIDSNSKRLSIGRSNLSCETEVVHTQNPRSITPNGPRTRSKSRADKWAGLTNTTTHDKEDISSTMSDPGPIWDAEPRWDPESNWDLDHNPIELPGPGPGPSEDDEKMEMVSREEKWVLDKGRFLGVLVCNHSCKTVQSLSSQVVAPSAEHDDGTLDLLLVRGSGRFRLLRFFLLLQMGRHLSLPYVEYLKVKSVKLKPGKFTHNGCGIDGELFPVNGQVICSLLPEQCQLIGRSASSSK